ncbi:MAG: M48 family metallopeptidase [Ruminococcaceae bacterium]|nr:M48 family metallopeptidase [Oscillospiraceae bacterium]
MRTYRLIRSDRKTVSLCIDEDLNVIVRAPKRLAKTAIDDFVSRHEAWIESHLARRRELNAGRRTITVTAVEEARLRETARRELSGILAVYAARMGVAYTRFTITGARTRWGSCSGKNALSFSWRTMLLPPECREYVVVHELCHILQHNHSAAFWREVKKILPDYREREGKIRTFSKENEIVTE